jgi:hypothetical protein
MMRPHTLFKQKLELVSPFRFFLWILALSFGIICSQDSAFSDEKLYNVKGKRDPFTPLVGSSTRPSAGGLLGVESIDEIVIEGIVVDADPKNTIVIVNGSVMKEGEELGNVKVLKIDPNGAMFAINGIEDYKQLYQEDKPKGPGEKNS